MLDMQRQLSKLSFLFKYPASCLLKEHISTVRSSKIKVGTVFRKHNLGADVRAKGGEKGSVRAEGRTSGGGRAERRRVGGLGEEERGGNGKGNGGGE